MICYAMLLDIQRSLLVMEASDRLSAEACLGDIYFEHLDHTHTHRSAAMVPTSKFQPSGAPVQQQQQMTNASHSSSNPNNSPGGVHWPQIPVKFNATGSAAAGGGDMDWHQQGGAGVNKPGAAQIPNINPGSGGGGIAMTAATTAGMTGSLPPPAFLFLLCLPCLQLHRRRTRHRPVCSSSSR